MKKIINENDLKIEEKDDFSMCHHCKCYFHKKNLVKCNYRSSLMGTPIVNRNSIAPVIPLEGNQKEKDLKKRAVLINRKKNNYCHYSKKSKIKKIFL